MSTREAESTIKYKRLSRKWGENRTKPELTDLKKYSSGKHILKGIILKTYLGEKGGGDIETKNLRK